MKSKEEECQVETSPPKITFEDSCINQQSKEFLSSFGKTLGKKTDEVERKEETELSVKNELSEKSEENEKHLVKENKLGISENNINVCAKMSDVRQPILVPMYKDVLFITNQIHNQLSTLVVVNRFIMITYFIQKTSDMMHVVKENFSTKIFVYDPGGRLNIPTLEDGADLRMNHLQEGGKNDMILQQAL